MVKSSIICPKCQGEKLIRSGIVNNRQRHTCKDCGYNFSVQKEGKKIDQYYVIKALQLYLEGVSYREIERILGVSHVSVANWVKQYAISKPLHDNYHPSYQIMKHQELVEYLSEPNNLKGAGMMLTELGDKFMLIKWERFRER